LSPHFGDQVFRALLHRNYFAEWYNLPWVMDPLSELVLSSSIRTFLLIENRLLREALVRLFSKRADLLVVGQCGYADAGGLHELDSKCDVLVIDSLQIPWLSRITAIEATDRTSFRTIVIARESDEKHFLAAVRLGIAGYLLQDASASEVVAAVPYSAERQYALPNFARRYSVSLPRCRGRCLFTRRPRSPISLCVSSNWWLLSPKVSQIRKSLLT
jgi:DNA-binding NarL/FixJ family response regulator